MVAADSSAVGSSPRGRGTHGHAGRDADLGRFIPARAGNASGIENWSSLAPVHPRAGGERVEARSVIGAYSGSSPRGRGTRQWVERQIPRHRFIPARAGNACRSSASASARSVHPRAGGERLDFGYAGLMLFGSSPRGRGTLHAGYGDSHVSRFIPARAGNAHAPISGSSCCPVHPRAGGERLSSRARIARKSGSSPRGRGTPKVCFPDGSERRFIPARAGNASRHTNWSASSTVHPRAGGERVRCSVCSTVHTGSSPRGRGTRTEAHLGPMDIRFIPARAGNAIPLDIWGSRRAVHPRAGGERHVVSLAHGHFHGSSPRGRGTLRLVRRVALLVRFIPARAGNARRWVCCASRAAVHPRAGGERCVVCPVNAISTGSSPRGRGTRQRAHRSVGAGRFIPARAGNARWPSLHAAAGTVHPRAGGERVSANDPQHANDGSSPRGRGTREARHVRARRARFIPARAGNARSPIAALPAPSVHPRAGGERCKEEGLESSITGSSPRGRGTPPAETDRFLQFRFIPARAGNARPGWWTGGRSPVHPRAGGERWWRSICAVSGSGSSPRGRGTRQRLAARLGLARFIPARAGNAETGPRSESPYPVHPRAGGERRAQSGSPASSAGSSPRGRGTPREPERKPRNERFIPARAGNAGRLRRTMRASTVHPRAGGERRSRLTNDYLETGSSPRGRGTLTTCSISGSR